MFFHRAPAPGEFPNRENAGVCLAVTEKRLWCSRRDSNPRRKVESLVSLTGLDYGSVGELCNITLFIHFSYHLRFAQRFDEDQSTHMLMNAIIADNPMRNSPLRNINPVIGEPSSFTRPGFRPIVSFIQPPGSARMFWIVDWSGSGVGVTCGRVTGSSGNASGGSEFFALLVGGEPGPPPPGGLPGAALVVAPASLDRLPSLPAWSIALTT